MNKEEKVSTRQFTIFMSLFTMGTAILTVPANQASYAGRDGWLATIMGAVLGLLLVWLYTSIGKRHPSHSLVQLNEKLLGKWAGKALSLLFIVLLFIGGPAQVLYYVGNFMTSQMMPDTPIQAFHIVFALVVVMGARLGLEVLGRAAELLFPSFLLLFILFILLVAPQAKIDNVQPVLELGFRPMWPAVIYYLSLTALPAIAMLMIFPSQIDRPQEARKAFFVGYTFGAIVMILIVALSILVLGSDLTERNMYPSYALAKKISVGRFLERLEAVMAFIWFISLYFKLSLYFYATVTALAQIFNMKEYRPLVLPLGMIMVALSLIESPSSVYEQTSELTFWVPFMLLAGAVYPLLLLGLSVIRKARRF